MIRRLLVARLQRDNKQRVVLVFGHLLLSRLTFLFEVLVEVLTSSVLHSSLLAEGRLWHIVINMLLKLNVSTGPVL